MMIVDTTGETVAIQFYKREKYDNQQISEKKKYRCCDFCVVVYFRLDTLLINRPERHEDYFINKDKSQRMT